MTTWRQAWLPVSHLIYQHPKLLPRLISRLDHISSTESLLISRIYNPHHIDWNIDFHGLESYGCSQTISTIPRFPRLVGLPCFPFRKIVSIATDSIHPWICGFSSCIDDDRLNAHHQPLRVRPIFLEDHSANSSREAVPSIPMARRISQCPRSEEAVAFFSHQTHGVFWERNVTKSRANVEHVLRTQCAGS